MQKIRFLLARIEKILRGPFLLFFVMTIVFASVIGPVLYRERVDPGSTLYGFPMSYLGDYFQYIYEVKSGQQGKLLFDNVYTTDPTQVMLLEPHYNVIGLLSRPFGISPFEAYFIAKLFAVELLIFMAYLLISRVTENGWSRLGMAVMVIFSTSIWYIDEGRVSDPWVYSNYFNVFTKFNNGPLHHVLAIGLLMIILLRFSKPSTRPLSLCITAITAIIASLLHTHIAVYMFVVWGINFIITSILQRKINKPLLINLVVFGFSMAPIVGYYYYLLLYVWKNDLEIVGQLTLAPRYISLFTYMKALGPVLVLAMPAIFMPSFYKHAVKRLVLLWAFIPMLMFLFPDIGIPLSSIRIFQTFQFIPMSILAGLVLERICKKFRVPFIPIISIVMIGFLLYGVPNYIRQSQWYTSSYQPYFGVYGLIKTMQPTLKYLANQTPAGTVVLASERSSALIPDFTSNRIIIGHAGTNPNYTAKMNDVTAFLSGTVADENIMLFLDTYHVSYIIFGAESPTFESLPYAAMPYFTEVFRDGQISVVAVNRSK